VVAPFFPDSAGYGSEDDHRPDGYQAGHMPKIAPTVPYVLLSVMIVPEK
jgi:hypothetical protein